MPRYRYQCGHGHVTEKWVPVENHSLTVQCPRCNDLAEQIFGAQVAAPSTWATPIYSDSMGVHPSQVTEAREHSKKIGIPVDFTKDGRAIFTSRQQRRDYCRHFGVRDNDGGYGDP